MPYASTGTRILIAAMVLAIIFATVAAQAGAVSGSSSTGSIPVELHFDASDLSFDKYHGYDLISVPGCRFTREIGKPSLPAKSIFVALPANSELTGIEVVSCRTKTLSGEYMILPAQPPIPTMAGAAAEFAMPGAIYDSSDRYPDAICGGASVGSLRGYKILSFRVFPLQYSPAERRLILHEEIILDVKYETPRYAATDSGGVDYAGGAGRTWREDDEFYRIAEGLVANPGDISRAMPTTRTITEARIMLPSKPPLPEGNVEYVIITKGSLEDEFRRLADWKTKKGVPATIVNTSWIEGNYAGTGVDMQERIRNFINDTCTAWGTKWVLLGGDTGIIPCRGGYGWVNGSAALSEESCEDKAIPADLYYSDLDGNWDANGNLTYGEVNDSVDLYPDVFVGRAPVDSVAEASTFVNKTLRYEKNPPPNYTRDILFLAEYLDAETDGGDTKDIIEADCMSGSFSLVKLYERYGNLSKDSAMGELNRGCNIVNHIGHGYTTGFYVGSGRIGNSDASSLTNSPRNFILYSIACNSNNFERDSVSERYMNNEGGGSVGYIGNSRYGWYDPELPPGEGPSERYDREFFNITLSESAYHLGEVVGYSKVRYIPLSQEDETAMRWLQYAINLLGDPELPIRTETPRNFSILMPSQIPARKQTLAISVSEIGHDNRSVQVRNATVCIMKHGEVYEVSKTDASGLAEFTIDPDVGRLDVTVTKENYRVYEGMIDIYSPDIYVNTTGWWRDGGTFNANGTPIQSAVDDADSGDTIFVRNGSYTENVDVDKTLTLRGEGADVVTVTAASSTDHVFEVSADWVNISGFAVKGATGFYTAGFRLVDADHCNIYDNNVSNNYRGICMSSSSNNTLENNIVNSNYCAGIYIYRSNNSMIANNTINSSGWWGDGIRMGYSSNNTLINNTASSNRYGIYLGDYSSNNTLKSNDMYENRYNFGIGGNSLSCYTQNIDTSNTVDGKPIYYWVGRHDEVIPCGAGFVGVVNSTNITARDLVLSSNMRGVLFVHTRNSRIVNVTASDNYCGIELCHSSGNTLAKNNASNNCWDGIILSSWTNIDPSSNNTLMNNILSSNGGYGIYLSHSSNSMLKCNAMSENRYNFGISGNSISDYTQNIDASNTVDGKPIYYWVDKHDETIPTDAGYIGVVNSTNITVRDMTLTKNHEGVLFAHTDGSRIENVTISDNYYGIELDYSSNNALVNNVANSNADGIHLYSSNDNILTNNTASNNREGIKLDYSSNNTVHSNIVNSNNWIGISMESSSNNNITCNFVQNNTDCGFYLQDRSTNNNISYNNIIENGNYNTTTGGWEWQFYVDQYNPVEAKHNYWGAGMNNGTIDASIYAEEDGWGEVAFYPFEGESFTCTPEPARPVFTTADAVTALWITVGSRPPDPRWDVSGDGNVTSLDALMILQAAAGAIRFVV